MRPWVPRSCEFWPAHWGIESCGTGPPIGGKSLAERFVTARCALLDLCPGAAVVGHRVPSSTCTKHSGVARGELNVSCLIGHERARGVVQGTSVVRALT